MDNWDFSGGEAEFRKALELDPSDATAHQWFAEDLATIGGRAQEAINEANRAYQLDPLSPMIGYAQGAAYNHDRQFDKAIERYKKISADNPTFGVAHLGLVAPSELLISTRDFRRARKITWCMICELDGDGNGRRD